MKNIIFNFEFTSIEPYVDIIRCWILFLPGNNSNGMLLFCRRTKKKKAKLDSYMQTISESPPATPRLQHVLPVPVPNGGWPLLLPPARQNTRPATPKLRHAHLLPLEALPPASYLIEQYTPPYTPTHKPRKPRVAHKHPSLREKNGSPLKQAWVLPESDYSSGEDQQG